MMIIVLILLCICCFESGLLIGLRPLEHGKKFSNEPTPEQVRAAKRAQTEYNNFLNYDGSEQEEII